MMLETTGEERQQAWSNGPKSFLARVIRDVDVLVEALRPFAGQACDDDSDIPDDSTWDAVVSYGDIRRAHELLRKPDVQADL